MTRELSICQVQVSHFSWKVKLHIIYMPGSYKARGIYKLIDVQSYSCLAQRLTCPTTTARSKKLHQWVRKGRRLDQAASEGTVELLEAVLKNQGVACTNLKPRQWTWLDSEVHSRP